MIVGIDRESVGLSGSHLESVGVKPLPELESVAKNSSSQSDHQTEASCKFS